MDVVRELMERGFSRVTVLDGPECGAESPRLVLAFWLYEAAPETDVPEAVIHPYYPASQAAYRAAEAFCRDCQARGISLRQETHLRLKPILNRLSFLSRGRNTLSYLPETGSRFHVQAFVSETRFPVTDRLKETEHGLFCGSCRRCVEACPTGAIREGAFEKKQCLRWWMLNGQTPPEEIRKKMGNRLLGCDACEACCPHNPPARGTQPVIPLKALITGEEDQTLPPLIGSNYAIPNRLRTQGCVMAESLKRGDLAPEIGRLAETTRSAVVREAAGNALRELGVRS